MKSKLFIIVFLIIVASFFPACKKKPFNSRNKYIGEWEFNVERRTYGMDSSATYFWDTLIYTGRIDYAEGNNNQLLVQYTAEDAITIEVDKDGNITPPCYYCSANFIDNNSLYMYLQWGGHGEGLVHTVDGRKK